VRFYPPPCAVLPGRGIRLCLFPSPHPSVFPCLLACSCSVFLCFFPLCAASPLVTVLFYSRSILLRQPCCCSGLLASFPFWPFTASRSSSSMKQPGSTLVLRWVLINLRSTYLRWTRAYTHHPTVTTGLSALHRRLAIRRLHCTCRDVSSTRLSVDLTRRRVSPTLRAAASSCNLFHRTVRPSGRSSTFITAITGCLVFCCISVCIYVYVFSCISLLFYVGFIFMLFCMGYSLHMVLGLIFVVETSATLWFFAVLALQLSFHSGSCFTRIGLFTESLCNLHRLVRPWNRPGLLIVLFELLVITIACCSVFLDRIQNLFLYFHCILSFGLCCWGALPSCFGFIVGEPTPFSFIGCLTSSSFRIRSE
jgi:hypothetical protein